MAHNLHRCLTFLLIFLSFSASAQDPLLDILQKELTREFVELKKQEIPPYFMSYKVSDRTNIDINGSFGCMERVTSASNRMLATQIRVGSPNLDNFHEIKGAANPMMMMSRPQLPVENNEDAIRQILWQTTNENYYQAIQKLTQIKGNQAVNVPDEDKSPDFSAGVPVQFCEPQMKTTLDKGVEEKLTNKVRLYSKAFAQSKDITSSSVRFQIVFARDYFVSTEGTKIAENHPSINLFISGMCWPKMAWICRFTKLTL